MRIFLSSTYEDLKEIRKIAINYLKGIIGDVKNATGEIVAMEFFDGSTRTCKGECLQELSTCDLMIGIYADRYGTVDSDGRSMTEIEYDYAIEHHIPILAFVKRSVSREEQQKTFIDEKIYKRNELCASFEGSEDFIDRLNGSLHEYLKDLDGYSINSLWDQVEDLKGLINKPIEERRADISHLQMTPYLANDTDLALEAIYESARYLAEYKQDLYEENQAVHDYAYMARCYPNEITDKNKKELCKNIEKNADLICGNWDSICMGIPNHTRTIILAVSFLKLKRMQERLITEQWSEELRQEVIRVREEYKKTILESTYED